MRLLHDRYAAHHDRAVDLVTGQEMTLAQAEPVRTAASEVDITSIVELFDHGLDGVPRWIVLDVRNGAQAAALARRAAAAAQCHGFVAMTVASYGRYAPFLQGDLANRAVFLIGTCGASAPQDHQALLAAAAVSMRPHVLMSFRASGERSGPTLVREARAIYGNPSLRVPSSPALLAPDVRAHLARGARADEFIESGRHAAAERLLRDVTAALERRGALREAARLMQSLVALLVRRGRLDAAASACTDAARLARASGDSQAALLGSLWDATIRIERMRLVEAESIARAVLLGPPSSSVRLRAELVLAQTLIAQHRPDEATALLQDEPDDWAPFDAGLLRDVRVKVLLATGRTFDAGLVAYRMVEPFNDEPASASLGYVAGLSRLRVLCAAGALGAAKEARGRLRELSAKVRHPLMEAEATLAWAGALSRAGRRPDAAREVRRLQQLARVATPRLRQEILQTLSGTPVVGGGPTPVLSVHVAPDLIRLAAEEDDDELAIRRVLQRLARELGTSRVDVVSADGGAVTVTMSSGSGVATTLGTRVMEAGIALGYPGEDHSREVGMPVRRGQNVIGAIVTRWPIDRSIPGSSRSILELAAAVIAPRLDSWQSRGREAAASALAAPALVGTSAAIEEVRRAIVRAARAPFPVLIEGESGTGKELVARAIHRNSARRERRFCDVNCAALPDDLLESELFGHTRGAFTGALVDRAGLFEEANGGTLFMDEVADLSSRAQAKLLRVVQQQEIRRLGETVSRPIDVRLIAAANRDLQTEADAGRFRHDLLYRLNVIRIRIPPLRDRAADVPALAQHFWREAAPRVGSSATLTPPVLADLARYHWPGNVRELQNAIAALAVAAPSSGRVKASLLPSTISGAAPAAVRLAQARDQFERRFVEVALAQAGGSRTRAAAALGITRQGLLKTIARLGITRAGGRAAE